ncbi:MULTISPECIES: acyl-CoA thioesterase [Rufibacter]|uniref:Acyl-CoA thioester hydrolase n=1 Tax=Rufibacter quisquiliarum TaxID=1549639 RepID=A0A839GLU6_9BACT|nr:MULTISPECIES: acyl-CoA thioesterase [Rufibacter]MBA9077789.1 acyl-CoA thioester hydrolase [Rufibacter quisquiliarum]
MSTVYEGHVIWAQVDANMHLRHSAYADFAAQARIAMLNDLGLDFSALKRLQLGPILFREELQYLREVGINDTVKIHSLLVKTRKDGSRWSIRHELYRSDGVKAAIINVDGAWMDVAKRKLTALPEDLARQFLTLPKADDFEEEAA